MLEITSQKNPTWNRKIDSPMKNFECSRCGTCCTWPGYVRLTPDETEKIAQFLNIDISDFTTNYTDLTADRRNLTLKEKNNGSCIFYKPNPPECLINNVKPKQCVNFPLIWNFEGWEDLCEGAENQNLSNNS